MKRLLHAVLIILFLNEASAPAQNIIARKPNCDFFLATFEDASISIYEYRSGYSPSVGDEFRDDPNGHSYLQLVTLTFKQGPTRAKVIQAEIKKTECLQRPAAIDAGGFAHTKNNQSPNAI